jgi:hypothetical protein
MIGEHPQRALLDRSIDLLDRVLVLLESNRSGALMIVCSERMRSGLASAWAWPSRRAGSTMDGAVMVMTPFESAVRSSLEGARGGRIYVCLTAGVDRLHHYLVSTQRRVSANLHRMSRGVIRVGSTGAARRFHD